MKAKRHIILIFLAVTLGLLLIIAPVGGKKANALYDSVLTITYDNLTNVYDGALHLNSGEVYTTSLSFSGTFSGYVNEYFLQSDDVQFVDYDNNLYIAEYDEAVGTSIEFCANPTASTTYLTANPISFNTKNERVVFTVYMLSRTVIMEGDQEIYGEYEMLSKGEIVVYVDTLIVDCVEDSADGVYYSPISVNPGNLVFDKSSAEAYALGGNAFEYKLKTFDLNYLAGDTYSVYQASADRDYMTTTAVTPSADKTATFSVNIIALYADKKEFEFTLLKFRGGEVVLAIPFKIYYDTSGASLHFELSFETPYMNGENLYLNIENNGTNGFPDLSSFETRIYLLDNVKAETVLADGFLWDEYTPTVTMPIGGFNNKPTVSLIKPTGNMAVSYGTSLVTVNVYDSKGKLLGFKFLSFTITQNPTAIEAVVNAINSLPKFEELTLADKTAVDGCIKAYYALSSAQAQYVYNAATLMNAKSRITLLENVNLAEEAIAAIGEVTYSPECFRALEKARYILENQVNYQNYNLVFNYSVYEAAYDRYYQLQQAVEEAELAGLDGLKFNCGEVVYLYYNANLADGSDGAEMYSPSPFTIKETSSLTKTLDWKLSSTGVVFGYSEIKNTYTIVPMKLGEAQLFVTYSVGEMNSVVSLIRIVVLDEKPKAVISATKDSEGAFTVFDTITVSAGLNMDFDLSNEVKYAWYLNGKLMECVESSFSQSFPEGVSVIKLVINDPVNYLVDVAVEKNLSVSKVADAQITLSATVEGGGYLLLSCGEALITALINGVEDTSYEYSWSVGDNEIVDFKYNPMRNNYCVIQPKKAGSTKLYIMVDIGRLAENKVIYEIQLTVVDAISDLKIATERNYYKTGATAWYLLTTNGVSAKNFLNLNTVWNAELNGEVVPFEAVAGGVAITHTLNGRYNISATLGGQTVEVRSQVAAVPLDKLLLSIVPIVIIIAAELIFIRLFTKGKYDKLASINKSLTKQKYAIINAAKVVKSAEKFNKLAKFKVYARLTMFKLAMEADRIKAKNYYIEKGMDDGLLIGSLDDSITVASAISGAVSSYENQKALAADLFKLNKLFIKNNSVLVEELISIRDNFEKTIIAQSVSYEEAKPKHKVAKKAKTKIIVSVDECVELLKAKNMFNATDEDDDE